MTTTNRGILLFLALVVYVSENIYFGWNTKPQSFAEGWWDQLVINLFVFGLFVRKMGVTTIPPR